jgi:hypothetical protein
LIEIFWVKSKSAFASHFNPKETEIAMKFLVTASSLNMRAGPNAQQALVVTLPKGTLVDSLDTSDGLSRWVEVSVSGTTGWVARRYLAQTDQFPILSIDREVERKVSTLIAALTSRYDLIQYRLGCKAKRKGSSELQFSGTDVAGAACSGATVDCSGWIYGIVDVLAHLGPQERPTLLTDSFRRKLITHSDGQVCAFGVVAGGVWSGTDIDSIPQHGGLIIGMNNGDYDWEGANRVLEIDHIVITYRKNGALFVSQSSSSGGGVNSVPWPDWRAANDGLFRNNRVHAVSMFAQATGLQALGTNLVPRARGLNQDENADPFIAPPG